MSTDEEQAPEERRTSALTQISNTMVRLYKEQFGRGPTSARTNWAGPDTIITVLAGHRDRLVPNLSPQFVGHDEVGGDGLCVRDHFAIVRSLRGALGGERVSRSVRDILRITGEPRERVKRIRFAREVVVALAPFEE